MAFTEQYDVVVVGAGHAGCEAAMAAARMGLKTALITMNLDLIAQMSCNPAIGGVAKGHLVREVDALGGIMGEVADAVGIQFRLLNSSRGPAVWSPRAQCDKQLYRVKMREVLESQPGLHIRQAEVVDLVIEESASPNEVGAPGPSHLGTREETSINQLAGAPGPGSPRTGPGPWGGDPSPLGTGETPYLNWAGALGLDDPKTTLRVPPVPRNWGPGIACPYRRPRAVLAPGGSERQ